MTIRKTMFLVMNCIYYIPMCKSNKVHVNEETSEECKYTWITNWNQQHRMGIISHVSKKIDEKNEGIHMKLFPNVQERVLILFLSILFSWWLADSSRALGLTSGFQRSLGFWEFWEFWDSGGHWVSTVVLYCWCYSDTASVLLYFTLVRWQFLTSCPKDSG